MWTWTVVPQGIYEANQFLSLQSTRQSSSIDSRGRTLPSNEFGEKPAIKIPCGNSGSEEVVYLFDATKHIQIYEDFATIKIIGSFSRGNHLFKSISQIVRFVPQSFGETSRKLRIEQVKPDRELSKWTIDTLSNRGSAGRSFKRPSWAQNLPRFFEDYDDFHIPFFFLDKLLGILNISRNYAPRVFVKAAARQVY